MRHPKDMKYMDEPCYVYVLVNPETKQAIYIGISVNPWWRFEEHCRDRSSAAWPALSIAMDGRGLFHRDEILKIYKKCEDRRTALELEYRLVTATPNLLNRPYVCGKGYT